jgi:hypothetical protein
MFTDPRFKERDFELWQVNIDGVKAGVVGASRGEGHDRYLANCANYERLIRGLIDKGIDFAFVVAADRRGKWPKYKYTYVCHRPAEELHEILKSITPIVGKRRHEPFWLLTRDLEPAFIDTDDDDEDYF